MRQIAFYALVLINLLLVASCGANNSSDKYIQDDVKENNLVPVIQENKPMSSVNDDIAEEKLEEQINTFPDDHYYQGRTYSIATSVLTNMDMERPDDNTEWTKSLEIKYPQLYNLEDEDKQNRINELIFEDVISYHHVLSNRDYINYSLDYKITTSTDELLSILFYGSVSDYRTENRFAYTITFSVETEQKISLDEYITIDESFIEHNLFTKFMVVDNNFENLEENKPFIEQYVLSYDEKVHLNDFYIMEDKIGIIIPTYNSMGYILIEGEIN